MVRVCKTETKAEDPHGKDNKQGTARSWRPPCHASGATLDKEAQRDVT